MAFENIELRAARCFGWRYENPSWADLADLAQARGWTEDKDAEVDSLLAADADSSYFSVCEGEFADVDTDIRWRATFQNLHAMWKLEVADGGEVLPEDAAAFFSSEYFAKFAKRCADLAQRAAGTFRSAVEPRMREGRMLRSDPVKVEAVLDAVEHARSAENLRTGKYELK